jgi:hypothetical protein
MRLSQVCEAIDHLRGLLLTQSVRRVKAVTLAAIRSGDREQRGGVISRFILDLEP